ncbi:MAG: polysaccharide biosynthesis/export family protein [Candidatus Sulfotelmatobacter sp.]
MNLQRYRVAEALRASKSDLSTVFCTCLLVTGLAAQTVPAKLASESKLVTTSSAQPVPAAEAATKPHDNTFVIGNDDVLAINVWKEPDISRSIPVRSDGKISLPLAGEIQAAGLTPLTLEKDIASKLKSYISEPEVTVMVQQVNSQKFNILGQVARPGSYVIANSPTVLDALALAGGFRDFAKKKSIYVLRQGASGDSRISFNYKDVSQGKNMTQNIKLQPGDTIIVP